VDYVSGAALSGSPDFVNLTGSNLSLNLMEPPIDGGLYAATVNQLYAPNANPTGYGQLTALQILQVQKSLYNASTNPTGLLTTITPVSYTYPAAIPEPSSSALIAGVAVLLPAWFGLRRGRKMSS
jgi:hypothetical protein